MNQAAKAYNNSRPNCGALAPLFFGYLDAMVWSKVGVYPGTFLAIAIGECCQTLRI